MGGRSGQSQLRTNGPTRVRCSESRNAKGGIVIHYPDVIMTYALLIDPVRRSGSVNEAGNHDAAGGFKSCLSHRWVYHSFVISPSSLASREELRDIWAHPSRRSNRRRCVGASRSSSLGHDIIAIHPRASHTISRSSIIVPRAPSPRWRPIGSFSVNPCLRTATCCTRREGPVAHSIVPKRVPAASSSSAHHGAARSRRSMRL